MLPGRTGKETQARHYSNESNMIARIVLGGMTAKQWAQVNGIDGEPRDSMSAANWSTSATWRVPTSR
jgi:hypothetical protein